MEPELWLATQEARYAWVRVCVTAEHGANRKMSLAMGIGIYAYKQFVDRGRNHRPRQKTKSTVHDNADRFLSRGGWSGVQG